MYQHSTDIRVRYIETDQMGYVYHGHYVNYCEVGRVEALRELGVVYKDLEMMGIIMPVLEVNMKYYKPAKYDDVITLKTSIPEFPQVRTTFIQELFIGDKAIGKGRVTLVFVDMKTGQPCEPPKYVTEKLASYYNQ